MRECAEMARARAAEALPEEDGHQAARRDGTPSGTGTRRQFSGMRVRTQQERAGTGRATRHARREVVFGPRRGQRTFVGWGVERHGQQAAQRVQRTSWQPSLVTTADDDRYRL